MRSKTKSKNFQRLKLLLYYSLLWVIDIYGNQNVIIQTTQNKNVILNFISLLREAK